jgi:hypothetical protein
MALQLFINNLVEFFSMQLIIDMYTLYLFSSFLIVVFLNVVRSLGLIICEIILLEIADNL